MNANQILHQHCGVAVSGENAVNAIVGGKRGRSGVMLIKLCIGHCVYLHEVRNVKHTYEGMPAIIP